MVWLAEDIVREDLAEVDDLVAEEGCLPELEVARGGLDVGR